MGMEISARFRIVTPAFVGGANPNKTAELRVPSIKGALRFWWRALAWSRFKSPGVTDESAITEMQKTEADLFGSASGGQSKVLLRILWTTGKPEQEPARTDLPGARYLGYGAVDMSGGARQALKANSEFLLQIRSRTPMPSDLVDAVQLLGLLGGIGSKSRKGYGSLALMALQGASAPWSPPTDSQSYIDAVSRLLAPARDVPNCPPYSAFSCKTRMTLLLCGESQCLGVDGQPRGKLDDDPMAVLDQYGRQMQRYRSWGNEGKVNGEDSEQNFKKDHDWGTELPRPKGFHPERAIFGLPHNYGQASHLQVSPSKHERRASPLFFHVHDFGSGARPRYAGIAVILESAFLPDDEKIDAGKDNPVAAKPDYGRLCGFFDGCIGHRDSKTAMPYFPDAREIFP